MYWRAPGSSKQIVRGMRDTLLTPADIDYYSDRFGIVQSNFPDRIRMGDGLDVADVMHPLSPAGLRAYDFAIVDSTSIRTATDRIDVYQFMYRPRDPRQPRAIGSAYLDVRTADIVRLDLTFTRAAILDKRIELLSVSLENALIEGRAWLPFRQSIEVVRTGTWLSFEARGIIRGRWEVCCYDVAFAAPPGLFLGAPISFVPPDAASRLSRSRVESSTAFPPTSPCCARRTCSACSARPRMRSSSSSANDRRKRPSPFPG